MKKVTTDIIGLIVFIMLVCASCASSGTAATAPVPAAGNAGPAAASSDLYDKLDPVIEKTFGALSEKLSPNRRVALLPPGSADRGAAGYVFDELYIKFINSSRYRMVDRADIDKAIQEQEFGLSGLVSDDTAARIGHLLGAEVIVFGDMPEIGSARQRLVFRALEVETGLMLGMSSERF
jgi:hypothetical protein